ncbi:MAG TPA: hypothetical protein VM118_02235 [Acidobacteriota bacterium]|nr:hypothetical protein [Acidobacteriota bacterium]
MYPLDERDLDDLARGSPAPLKLNLAIAFLTVFVSATTTLLTVTIASVRIFTIFVVIAVCTFLAGVILVSLWAQSRRSSKNLLSEIKGRMPPQAGIQEPLSGGTASPGTEP